MVRLLVLTVSILVRSLTAQTISEIPISFVPRFNLAGSDFEKTFSLISQEDDRVVLSEVDVIKLRYSSRSYIIPPEKQMVMFLGYRNISGKIEKNVSSIRGLLFNFDEGRVPRRKQLNLIREDCDRYDMEFFASLSYRDSKNKQRLRDIAEHADYLSIYVPMIIKTKPQQYAVYVSEIAKTALEQNGDLKIEVGVPTATNIAGTQMLAHILATCSPYVDRFAIYLDETETSISSALVITALLRNNDKTLQEVALPMIENLQKAQ